MEPSPLLPAARCFDVLTGGTRVSPRAVGFCSIQPQLDLADSIMTKSGTGDSYGANTERFDRLVWHRSSAQRLVVAKSH